MKQRISLLLEGSTRTLSPCKLHYILFLSSIEVESNTRNRIYVKTWSGRNIEIILFVFHYFYDCQYFE